MRLCYLIKSYQLRRAVVGLELHVEATMYPGATSLADVLQRSFPGLCVEAPEEEGWLVHLSSECDFRLSGRIPESEEIEGLLEALQSVVSICDDCDVSHCLGFYRKPVETASSPEEWPYTPVGKLVYRGKYKGDTQAAVEVGHALLDFVRKHAALAGADALAAVPRSSQPAGQIDLPGLWSRLLAQELGMQEVPLYRVRPTLPQKSFADRATRESNQQGSMSAPSELGGRAVMVLDDLYTEGFTMAEAVRALRASGAQSVFGLCAVKTAKGTRGIDFADLQ